MKNQSKKICILTVPYITSAMHYRYALETLKSFKSSKHQLFNLGVINKLSAPYSGKILPLYNEIIYNDENCLAKAWNIGIEYALSKGFDYILVSNLDVISTKHTIDDLIDFAGNYPDALMWCATEYQGNRKDFKSEPRKAEIEISLVPEAHSFSYFMIDKRLIKEAGKFFHYYPAYFEDWDMRDRIHLSGNYIVVGKHIPFFHYGNATRKHDRGVSMNIRRMFRENERVYLERKRKLFKN